MITLSITSLKHKVKKRIELKEQKTDYSDIGALIKKKRKEYKLTQSKLCKGTCSVSYLSKVENNLIDPNDRYVRELLKKLQISEDVVFKSISDKKFLERVIEAFFYMDDEEMERIMEEIKDIEHNTIINLCKLGYIVYFELQDEEQYVMMLEHLINNMSDYEMKVYLYFASIYYIQNHKYKTALELVLLNNEISDTKEILNGMISELSYYIKQRLLIKNCASEDYSNALEIYLKYHNMSRIMYLSLQKAKFLIPENPKKAKAILHTIQKRNLSKEFVEYYHYLNALVDFEIDNIQDATIQLSYISEDSKFYFRKMVLLLLICTIEKDYEMANNIKDIIKDYKPHRNEMESKVFYHFMVQESEEDKKEYLREIAIPFAIKIQDYLGLEMYTNEYMEICFSTSRYKEAMQYYKKYQKEISKVKSVLI